MTTDVLTQPHSSQIAAGVWRVADPKITLASAASMLVGASAAAWMGPISWGWLVLTIVGIFCVEAAKNASGEIFDWDSGADTGLREDERSPFSGGKRVIVDGLMTRAETALVAAGFYAVAVATGLAIVFVREPGVMWLGVLGIALAYFYHAPPFQLAYRGFGELAVAISYGPVIATGTYMVQRHTVDAPVLFASIPLGIILGAFLWINEFPDARADEAAGKRTLVVRLGRPRAGKVFSLIIAAAYLGIIALPFVGLPSTAWFGLLGLPHGMAAAHRLYHHPEAIRHIVPAQAWTLLSGVLMAVGIAAGFIVAALA